MSESEKVNLIVSNMMDKIKSENDKKRAEFYKDQREMLKYYFVTFVGGLSVVFALLKYFN